MDLQPTGFRIPEVMLLAAKERAASQERSLSSYVRSLISNDIGRDKLLEWEKKIKISREMPLKKGLRKPANLTKQDIEDASLQRAEEIIAATQTETTISEPAGKTK